MHMVVQDEQRQKAPSHARVHSRGLFGIGLLDDVWHVVFVSSIFPVGRDLFFSFFSCWPWPASQLAVCGRSKFGPLRDRRFHLVCRRAIPVLV